MMWIQCHYLKDTVEISGPRILIDQVDHVKASIKVDDN